MLLLGLSLLFSLCASPAAIAQQTTTVPAGSDWQRVEALPISTDMHIKAITRHKLCSLKRVDPDSLTCSHASTDIVFSRAEIRKIKLAHRGLSTAAGGGIGVGVGAVIGVAFSQAGSDGFFKGKKGESALIGAGLGAPIGLAVGFFTDLLQGPTVYKVP